MLAFTGCINIRDNNISDNNVDINIGGGEEFSDPDMDGDGVLNEDDIDPLVDVWVDWKQDFVVDSEEDITWTVWLDDDLLFTVTYSEITTNNSVHVMDWPDQKTEINFTIYVNTTQQWYYETVSPTDTVTIQPSAELQHTIVCSRQ